MKAKLPAIAIAVALSLNSQPAALADAVDAGPGGTPPVRPIARVGAPNVLVWMLDDVGFAQLGCYGGLVSTPNIDRVASMGLRYSNYHATPICSASRAAFLTGRNSHTVHVGGHLLQPRGFPGYDGLIPASAGTLAENLRQAGYATFALGKWDHILGTDLTPAGPFTYWPTHQGFDRFYGFLAAETDNWNPVLWEGVTPIAKPSGDFYHLNHDLADQAIAMINARSANSQMAPFFMYWATGTAHSPHQAPADWIARYKGKFDAGWDVARQDALKREIAAGIVPSDTKLDPHPQGMPAWDTLTPTQRRLYAHEMEVFAASLSYADDQFGRILGTLEARHELDNTIILITSDNGATAEGGPSGTYNNIAFFNREIPSDQENMSWFDKWGGPETSPTYAFGWAVAGDTPFRYWKQTTFEGGVRVPLVIAWPKGIAARDEWRDQFTHISDLTPTILEAAQEPRAAIVNGVTQSPFDGESIVYTFTHPAEGSHKHAQYFEMYGNKGLWADGWKIVTSYHIKTWDLYENRDPNDSPWELYNLAKDPGEVNNLARRNPAKVTDLDRLFREQAAQFHVDPIAGHAAAREYGQSVAAQEFQRRGGRWTYPAPVARISEAAAPPILFRSYTLTVDVSLATGTETGPIFAIGGAQGGLAFYLKDGRPIFIFRTFSGKETKVISTTQLPIGTTKLRLTFSRHSAAQLEPTDFDVGIAGDGKLLASQTVRFSMPVLFSGDNTFDIGRDDGSAVTEDYQAATAFPGVLSNIVFNFNQAQ